MDFNEYQTKAQRTSATNTPKEKLLNGLMGLNGEAGECIDAYKKHLFQGHDLDTNKLIDEVGDVLWYIAEIAEGLNISIEEIAYKNIKKLENRYKKNKFNKQESIQRKEEEKIPKGLIVNGEDGQDIDVYKKHLSQGHNLDNNININKLIDDSGGTGMAGGLNASIDEMAYKDIKKIENKYKENKFNKKESI